MKAIILCAGYGNRMRPLTDTHHKTLLLVGGETIIDRILNSLKNDNISEIVIVTGYLEHQLKRHIRKNHISLNIKYIHNNRYQETNNIFSLALAFEQIELDEDILFIESDLIYHENVIKRAINSKHENLALVSPYRIGMDGTVVQLSNEKITNIYPPHLHDQNFNLFDKFKTLNIYKFSKEFCQKEFKKLLIHYARSIDDNCYYELILGIIIYLQRQDIFVEIIENNDWVEVDDPNDLDNAKFQFNIDERISILNENFGGYWHFEILDFCFLRNMYFPSKAIMAEFKNNMPNLLQTYGSTQKKLNQKLSYVFLYNKHNLIALNGLSQIYPILKKIWGGKKGLIPSPTFGEYQKLFKNFETYHDEGSIFMKDILSKIDNSEVIVMVNPNNPTGTIIETDFIYKLINDYPNKIFIIDESFIEFSNETSIIDKLEVHAKNNVIVLRSMSKSYGLPGIRIGFAYTNDIILHKAISLEIPIWNMNSMAEFYMEIILKNKNDLHKSFLQSKIDRDCFTKKLKTVPFIKQVFNSHSNFILFEILNIHKEYENLEKILLTKYNIYIKNVSSKFENKNYFYRIAVRTQNENDYLLEALNSLNLNEL